jgi:hypothetical protein
MGFNTTPSHRLQEFLPAFCDIFCVRAGSALSLPMPLSAEADKNEKFYAELRSSRASAAPID